MQFSIRNFLSEPNPTDQHFEKGNQWYSTQCRSQ